MFKALASVEDMAFLPTPTVVTLAIGVAVRGFEVDTLGFGPVGIVPDLLGSENKIDGEELFANQFLLKTL